MRSNTISLPSGLRSTLIQVPVRVSSVTRSTATPIRQHDPGHPLADANGDVFAAPVDENAEMVEMMDSSRQYQNMVEALTTAKQLLLDTVRMK